MIEGEDEGEDEGEGFGDWVVNEAGDCETERGLVIVEGGGGGGGGMEASSVLNGGAVSINLALCVLGASRKGEISERE